MAGCPQRYPEQMRPDAGCGYFRCRRNRRAYGLLAEGTGFDRVVECLRDLVVPANRDEKSSLITRERHRTALEDTVASLEAALGHDFAMAPELAAEDYRRAADSLGRITGQIDAEELLGSIFSSFWKMTEKGA